MASTPNFVGPFVSTRAVFVWCLLLQALSCVSGLDDNDDDIIVIGGGEQPVATTARPHPSVRPAPTSTKSPDAGTDYFRVSHNGTDCIRAVFKINLTVEYSCLKPRHNSRRLLHRTCRVELAVPDPKDVSVNGRCGPEPILILSWSDKRLSLTFKFSKSSGEWFADHLEFSFDPKDKHFPNASEKKRKVLSAEKSLQLFKASLSRSYFCNATVIVDLGLGTSRHAEVTITESQVQVFNLPSSGPQPAFSEAHECPADNERPRSPVTAFVIASCLALLVILIIAGYYISRRSNPSPYATVD